MKVRFLWNPKSGYSPFWGLCLAPSHRQVALACWPAVMQVRWGKPKVTELHFGGNGVEYRGEKITGEGPTL